MLYLAIVILALSVALVVLGVKLRGLKRHVASLSDKLTAHEQAQGTLTTVLSQVAASAAHGNRLAAEVAYRMGGQLNHYSD